MKVEGTETCPDLIQMVLLRRDVKHNLNRIWFAASVTNDSLCDILMGTEI